MQLVLLHLKQEISVFYDVYGGDDVYGAWQQSLQEWPFPIGLKLQISFIF